MSLLAKLSTRTRIRRVPCQFTFERLEPRFALAWTPTPLGRLPGMTWSSAYGVSDDGTVVVGVSGDEADRQIAFRWTAGTGMQSLGTMGGESSCATAISGDGRVVVGWITTAGGWRAFRWTEATGMQSLGDDLGGLGSKAADVSADGSVVVGTTNGQAFRWTAETGMQALTFPVDPATWGSSSVANGVSDDGQVIAGLNDVTGFRWTATAGAQPLPGSDVYPGKMNRDGSVIVGHRSNVDDPEAPHAVRWTPANGLQDLGIPLSYAFDVNGDGSMVVGQYGSFAGPAFLWTVSAGSQDLTTLAREGGSRTIFVASDARGISATGNAIVGTGGFGKDSFSQAFLMRNLGAVGVEPPRPGVYKAGDSLSFTVRFSGPVVVTGVPTIDVRVGARSARATYVGGSGTDGLAFEYKVGRTDNATSVSPGTKIRLSSRVVTIRDLTGMNVPLSLPAGPFMGVTLDSTAPKTTTVAVPAKGMYVPGDVLRFTVTFTENVVVTGLPSIALTIDGKASRQAVYVGGSGGRGIVFEYRVQPGDSAAKTPKPASVIGSNGGSIADAAGNAAALGIKVPSLKGIVLASAASALKVASRS